MIRITIMGGLVTDVEEFDDRGELVNELVEGEDYEVNDLDGD